MQRKSTHSHARRAYNIAVGVAGADGTKLELEYWKI